jgi:two-component system LytT family sensor kinase
MVRVTTQANGGRLLVTVDDNGAGLATAEQQQRKTGTGLSNLRARLEALYGRDQKLEVVSRSGGGVTVRLEIPLRYVSVNQEPASLK